MVLKSDGEPPCKSIEKSASSTDDCAEQSCLKPWQQWSGRAHDAGGVRRLGIKIRTATAVRLGPSHPILAWGCPTRCLAAHAVPSEELWEDSALFAVWEYSGEIGLFGEAVFYEHKAICSRDGRKASSASASLRESTSLRRQDPMDGRNS